MSREIRCFDYVNQPYARVRDLLREDAVAVFRQATSAAAERAESVASELRVNVGAIQVGAEIDIAVTSVAENCGEGSLRTTRLGIEWASRKAPRLFPFMQAELAVYPLTPTETQLDFSGRYEPPLGLVGSALDAVAGHRLAEASVHRFLREVARYLREKR